MPNIQYRPRRPPVPAGRGEKNNDRIRVRNRWYKIERFMLQPRDVEVKHNGRVVRRMVVRRRTIYPSTRTRENINLFTENTNICQYYIISEQKRVDRNEGFIYL